MSQLLRSVFLSSTCYGEYDPLVEKFKKTIKLCEEKRTALEIDLEVGNEGFASLTETVTQNIEGFKNDLLTLSKDLSSKTENLKYIQGNHEYISISEEIHNKRTDLFAQKELLNSLKEELTKNRSILDKFKTKYDFDKSQTTSDQKTYEDSLSKSVWNKHDYPKFIFGFLIGLTVWSVLYFTLLLLIKMIIKSATWIIEGFKKN